MKNFVLQGSACSHQVLGVGIRQSGFLSLHLLCCSTCLDLIKIIWRVLLPSKGSLRPDPWRRGRGGGNGGNKDEPSLWPLPDFLLCPLNGDMNLLPEPADLGEGVKRIYGQWQHTTASLWWGGWQWARGIVSWDKPQWSDYLFADRIAPEIVLWEPAKPEMHCPLHASHFLLAQCFNGICACRSLKFWCHGGSPLVTGQRFTSAMKTPSRWPSMPGMREREGLMRRSCMWWCLRTPTTLG